MCCTDTDVGKQYTGNKQFFKKDIQIEELTNWEEEMNQEEEERGKGRRVMGP